MLTSSAILALAGTIFAIGGLAFLASAFLFRSGVQTIVSATERYFALEEAKRESQSLEAERWRQYYESMELARQRGQAGSIGETVQVDGREYQVGF